MAASDSTSLTTGGQQQVTIDVPHCQQKRDWDCGLACSKMILQWLQKDLGEWKKTCQACGFKTSVWTIDLANIMLKFGVPHLLTTVLAGVDKKYEKESFYRGTFSSEEQRITNLFQQAKDLGIHFEERVVGREEMIDHLRRGNPCIVLTDMTHLRCIWCPNRAVNLLTCCGKCSASYQGHFIVVCGFNLADNTFIYRNPNKSKALCCCKMDVLDRARTSFGTDEDILFVYRDGNSQTPKPASEIADTHL